MRDVRDASFIRWVDEEAGEDVGFVVQEKVCGMPVRMGCDTAPDSSDCMRTSGSSSRMCAA